MRPIRLILLLVLCIIFPRFSLKADEKTEPPVPVRMVPPEVPASFSHATTPGLVTINFLVDDKGNVQEPKVIKSTHPELEAPALKAIVKWRFKPAKKDGVAVGVRVTIPIKFEND